MKQFLTAGSITVTNWCLQTNISDYWIFFVFVVEEAPSLLV
jgi:hypothetical protein